MRKSICELSEEYFDGAAILDELIEKYRRKLSLLKGGSRTEVKRIEGLLRYYYSQRNDMLDTAHYLKNYYKAG